MSEERIGRWQSLGLRRARARDLVALAVIACLAIGTIVSGRRAHGSLRPRAAVGASRLLSDLDAPTRLPDAPLEDPAGDVRSLWARIGDRRAVVAFYAPWCEPCQRELPALVKAVGRNADVLVVVSKDEDRDECARKLANLGLASLGMLVDVTGALQREGRVTALPTTFVVNRGGGVVMRLRGYSPMGLYRLKKMLGGMDETPDGLEPAEDEE